METFGDLDALKKGISEKYDKKIDNLEAETKQQIAELKREGQEKLKIELAKIETKTDSETKKAHSKILNEEKLKAKLEFEDGREQLISSVFEEAEKRATKIAQSKEYADYIKKNLPKEKDYDVIADSSSAYSKLFTGKKIKVEKGIVGIKFKVGGVIYDLTLDREIQLRRNTLRQEVNKILFGE